MTRGIRNIIKFALKETNIDETLKEVDESKGVVKEETKEMKE